MLSVGVSSIKRWVDQGVLRATKTPGGHRRLATEDVQKLLQANAPANAATNSVEDDSELWMKLICSNVPQADLLVRLQEKRQELGSWWAICELLGKLLVRMGQQWTFGKLSIVDEHHASDRLERLLHSVTAALPCQPNAPTVLMMTAPSDEHTLGLLLVEVVLREAGLNVRWSGRNTPADQVRPLLQSCSIDFIAVSASAASTNRETLNGFAQALLNMCDEFGATLLLGGSGAWPEHLRGVVRIHSLRDLAAVSPAWIRQGNGRKKSSA